MTHDVSLIATLAAAFGLALVLGFIAVRIRIPALVGYLVAGVILGPATPGFVANLGLAQELAEIGVILLMFGVGLHFSLDDLRAVQRIAVRGALARIVIVTGLGVALAWIWGWGLAAGIVFGLALSVASTVVLLKALEGRGLLESINGRIAIGWLVVEDLVMVLVLVLLPATSAWISGPDDANAASPGGMAALIVPFAVTLGKVVLFVALMLVAGRRILPGLLWQVARTGSRELFTLCVVTAAVGIAYGSAAIFGVSFALGAFFSGLVLGESSLSHRAAAESLPLRDAFSVLFFVSVGMLFEPAMLTRDPLRVLVVAGVIVFAKTLVSFGLVLAFRYPLNTALTVSAGLAQIGEFSFLLAGLGVSIGILPAEGQGLILAGALISIAINPLLFAAIEPLQAWIRSRSELARTLELPDDPLAALPMSIDQARLTDHVVVVGYGRVGRRIGEALIEAAIPIVVAEQNREIVDALRERGVPAVAGDASDPDVLAQAHVHRARMLVIAVPDAFHARKMREAAVALRPDIETVVRVHGDEEAALLRSEGADQVFFGEEELALGMLRHVFERVGADVSPGRALPAE